LREEKTRREAIELLRYKLDINLPADRLREAQASDAFVITQASFKYRATKNDGELVEKIITLLSK
jgi:hypothetical protein